MKFIYNLFAGLGVVGFMAMFALWAAVIVGWVMNVIALVHMVYDPTISVLLVLRIVGIFFPPLGAVLGWFF